jgi:hypothetical protein
MNWLPNTNGGRGGGPMPSDPNLSPRAINNPVEWQAFQDKYRTPGGMSGGQPQEPRPAATPAPQGNAWGQQFQQQNGQPPGQLRDLWAQFRQQNGIGGGQPAATPPATGTPPATPPAAPSADPRREAAMQGLRDLQSNPQFQNSGVGQFFGGMSQLGGLFNGGQPGQGGGLFDMIRQWREQQQGGGQPTGTPPQRPNHPWRRIARALMG